MSTQAVMPETTIPPQATKDDKFRERRRLFIGGSDAYKLLNEPQYGQGCWTALAFEKLGVEPDYPRQLPPALMKRGHLLEPLAAALYMEKTGRKVVNAPRDQDGNPIPRINKEFPWAGVHVDRTILAGSGGVTETGDLELKSRAEGPFLRVISKGPFPGDILQVQWSNFVTDHSWGAFGMVGLFDVRNPDDAEGSLPFEHYDFPADKEIQETFKRAGSEFADKVWGKNELPTPKIAADDLRCKVCPFRLACRGEALDEGAVAAVKAQKGTKAELEVIENPELANLLNEREMVRAELATLDCENDERPGRIQVIEEQIIALQGECKAFIPGFGKSYITATAWSGFDQTRFKAENPELYAKYQIKGRLTGGTTLRTYPSKN